MSSKETLLNPARKIVKTVLRKGGAAGAVLVGLVLCPGDDIAVSLAVAGSTLRQDTPKSAVLPSRETLFEAKRPEKNGHKPRSRRHKHTVPLAQVLGPTKIVSIPH